MKSNFKTFLANSKLDAIPEIETFRSAKTTKDIVASLVTSNDDSKAYPTAPNYLDSDYGKIFEKCDSTLLGVTNFYFRGISTIFGDKPFEAFILNKTYREDICYSASRLDFFSYIASWQPFLRELIIDTCNFVVTGKRDIHPRMLLDISRSYAESCNESPKGILFPELNVKQRFEWKEIENMTSQEFFNAWIRQKGGLQDLICSHKTMLGL